MLKTAGVPLLMPMPKLAIGLLFVGFVATSHAKPTVVELFTSQGCSSCPPAEKYVGELARRPEVLALTFHVDYWDDLGWKDRFSSPAATARQRDYAKALGLRSVYTPQLVIGGNRQFVGSDRAAIESALQSVPLEAPVTLSIDHDDVFVDIGAMTGVASSDVILVAYLRSAISSIGRGENAGRMIVESNVVRDFHQIGRWQGAPLRWQVKLASIPGDATDLAVVVQRPRQGAIVGAAHIAVR